MEEENLDQDMNQNMGNQPESKGLSIAAMVLGIVSVVLYCFVYISIPCSILAIIFGFVGKNKGAKGMAIAGIVLGIIALALYILTWLGVASFVNVFSDTLSDSLSNSLY